MKTRTLKIVKNVLIVIANINKAIEDDLRSGENKTLEINQNLAEINELLLDCISEIEEYIKWKVSKQY